MGLLSLGWVLLAVGCAPPPISEGGFDAADPASRLYAIRQAAAQRDHGAIPELIEELDSDDPAVRLLAISALDQLVGTRRGYHAMAPLAERAAAVERWRTWWLQQRESADATR